MASKSDKCDVCKKSTLSLLLLRCSPIASKGRLVPLNTETVLSDEAVMNGLLPARRPTESRFVLRLLRSGYVYVYLPVLPAGMKSHWLVYRVTVQADLYPEGHPLFDPPVEDKPCSREGHNVAGAKLLHLPQAHEISDIWVAYSANLWNDALKEQNRANPKAMQHVSLAGGSANTFKPSYEELKTKVLECATERLWVNREKEHVLPFNGLGKETFSLADNLKRAAACHPKTVGKELAVVLRDPVGVAIELNEMRQRFQDIAQQKINDELELPTNQHALRSSHLVLSIRQLYEHSAYAEALDKWAPLATFKEFYDPKPYTPINPVGVTAAGLRYRGREWEELPGEEVIRIRDDRLGRAWLPDSAERASAEAKKTFKKRWGELEEYYSEKNRQQWHKDFDQWVQTNYLNTLTLYEVDWWGARDDALFNNYFALHFDEREPNKPLQKVCPGLVYSGEVCAAVTPAPFTSGVVLEKYLKELAARPTDPHAVMLRSLAANQAEVVAKIEDLMGIDDAADHLHQNRNDKLFALGMGLVLDAHATKTPNRAQKTIAKYNWLSGTLGNIFCAYGAAVVGAFSAAHSMLGTAAGSAALYAGRVAAALLVQRANDLALASVISNGALKVPLVIRGDFQAGRGMFLLTHGGHLSYGQAKGFIRNGRMKIDLHTDTQQMLKFKGDLEKGLLDGTSANRAKPALQQRAALLTHPALPGTLELSEAQFSLLFTQGGTRWGDLANKVKQALQDLSKSGAGQAARTVHQSGSGVILHSPEARLAFVFLVVNFNGILGAIQKLSDPTVAEQARLELWLSIADGTTSVLGAMLQIRQVAMKALLEQRHGLQAGANMLEQKVSVHAIRAASHLLGVIAGGINFWLGSMKTEKAFSDGHNLSGAGYLFSTAAFFGWTGVYVLQVSGAAGEMVLAKGIRNAFIRNIALRLAARYGATTVAGAAMSGWGWWFLGAATLFEGAAIYLTPTELQTWIGRTRFGDGAGRKFQSADEEIFALEQLFAPKDGPRPSNTTPPVNAMAAGAVRG